MNSLEQCLKRFSDITNELIVKLKNEDFDDIDELLMGRQEIINEIDKIDYGKDEFITVGDELKLVKKDNELGNLIKKKKDSTKVELKKILMKKNAHSEYSRYNNNNVIFSKKI